MIGVLIVCAIVLSYLVTVVALAWSHFGKRNKEQEIAVWTWLIAGIIWVMFMIIGFVHWSYPAYARCMLSVGFGIAVVVFAIEWLILTQIRTPDEASPRRLPQY